MSRTVPEAAPVVGVVLAIPFALYGFLFGSNHLSIVLVSAALLYGFTAFGIVRSDEPESVFRPDPILAIGFLACVPVFIYGLVDGQPLFGLLVATAIAGPPALYHARVGEPVNPLSLTGTLTVGLLVAGGVLLYGLQTDPLVGGLSAATIALAAVDYRRQRGDRLDRRIRTITIVVCLGGGLAAFGLLAVIGRSAEGLIAGGVAVVVGAMVAADAE